MPSRTITVVPPLAGIARKAAFQNAPPFTHIRSNNCRPYDMIDRRDRIGSRPGHVKEFTNDFSNPINMMASVRNPDADWGIAFGDDFSSSSLGSEWSNLTGTKHWVANSSTITGNFSQKDISGDGVRYIVPSSHTSTAVSALGLNTSTFTSYSSSYVKDFRLGIRNWQYTSSSGMSEKISIIIGCSSAYVPVTGSVVVQLEWGQPDALYAVNAKVYSYSNATTRSTEADVEKTIYQTDDIRIVVDTSGGAMSHTVSVSSINGTIYSGTLPNDLSDIYIGIAAYSNPNSSGSLSNSEIDLTGVSLVWSGNNVSTNDPEATHRLIGTGGLIYVENAIGTLAQAANSGLVSVDGKFQINDDFPIYAQERAGKVYIADYGSKEFEGTDGTLTSGGVFDSSTYSNWVTSLGLSAGFDDGSRVLVAESGTPAALQPADSFEPGVYRIYDVQTANIDLVTDNAGTAYSSSGNSELITFWIERGPKIYDPSDATTPIEFLLADLDSDGSPKGFVPTGCKLIALYRDRIVLARQPYAPHAWYMSRQGDPHDWDYAQEDDQRAVAGTSTQAGLIAAPLRALIPYRDDYLIFGCENQMWLLRGDPAIGGSIDNLSRVVGCLDAKSWCHTPDGTLYFLSRDGLYLYAGASPQSVSRERLPEELLDIDMSIYNVFMAYDVKSRGVLIYIVKFGVATTLTSWFYDTVNGGFWPFTLPAGHEPNQILSHEGTSGVGIVTLLGGEDGVIRRVSDSATNDDGTAISSYIYIGPIRCWNDDYEGVLNDLYAVLADASGGVDYDILVGKTPESALSATALFSGTWSAGLNKRDRKRARGNSLYIKLANDDTLPWALERITATFVQAGKLRTG